MHSEEHLEVDRIVLGEEHPEVHETLDKTYSLLFHRLTHHPLFVEKVIRPKYGDEGAKSAILHILTDHDPMAMGVSVVFKPIIEDLNEELKKIK